MRNIYLCIYASSIFPFSLLYTSLCTLELTLFTFACSNLTFKSCLSRTAKHSDIMLHSEQLNSPKKCISLRSWTIFEIFLLVKGLTTENLEKKYSKKVVSRPDIFSKFGSLVMLYNLLFTTPSCFCLVFAWYFFHRLNHNFFLYSTSIFFCENIHIE